MFRAQANTFDEVVTRATDENLTSENWALILDVCDRVSTSPTGPQSVTAALIKRLAHRNANVQLYTLELANALSQNCGAPIHRELSSRSFTDALLRLAADRNTHQQVKSKILERMQEWKDMFKGDADLGIMEQAYDKLRSSNPGLAPPSKPVKRQIEDTDRRKEDEELQMALALSLKDKASQPEPEASSATSAQPQSDAQQGTTAATVSRVKALYDFIPSEPGELAFKKGDVIAVIESVYKDWWKGSLRGQTGIFPLNYVEKLQDPTREELEKDAQTEADVFSQIRNVEKLLALLSVRGENSRDTGSEDEITDLYNQTLSIRPKLIELIGKYSQKKDEFTQLNEKFIKARRDYEALLESSMSQPQYAAPARQASAGYYNPYPAMQSGYPPQGPPPDQRYYNQPPSDLPPQNAYSYPPPMGNIPATPAPAPFHFLPNGAPPPEVRQSPQPMGPGPSAPPMDNAYNPNVHSYNDRPQSIHTLNSGNPQELSTNVYESPTDGRNNAYGPGAPVPAPLNYTSSPQPQQPTNAPPAPPQQQQQQQMPIRQRTSSFESPSSMYSAQAPPQDTSTTSYPAQYPPQQHGNQSYTSLGGGQPSAPPASAPAYQAYNPQGASQGQQPPQQQYAPPAGGDDASDYYR